MRLSATRDSVNAGRSRSLVPKTRLALAGPGTEAMNASGSAKTSHELRSADEGVLGNSWNCDVAGMTNPVKTWSNKEAGPTGIALYKGALYIGAVTGKRVWKVPVNGTSLGTPQSVFTGYGRVRAVAAAPDGTLWLGTSNQDNNGSPGATDDRILSTDG